MPKIDIAQLLEEKAPRWAHWVPRFVVNKLRRIVHESEINHIISHYWHLSPQEFIRACFRDWQVSYSIHGLEHIPTNGRYIFVSNHPFGGMDGMMLADELLTHFGCVRVMVNDLLMHVEPLAPLWLPVNKHGAQSAAYAQRIDAAFMGENPILTFPAGLCSRKIEGRIQDLDWKPTFLKKAYASHRDIVPIFVEGRLSNFFYRLDRLRRCCGIRFNIEMLWLVDEMFAQKGKHFRIIVGEPIRTADLQHLKSIREQVAFIRQKTYDLEKIIR